MIKTEREKKEEILSNIKIVTQGIIEDIGINNSFHLGKIQKEVYIL